MKKVLIASILGLVATAATYGQGSIWFDNYNAAPYMPVAFNGSTASVNPNIRVDLLYGFGVVSDANALTDLGLSVALNTTKVDSFGNMGYWDGSIVSIPGYTSGPVTFQVRAWDITTGATYASANIKAASALWQESGLATGLNQAQFFAGLPGPAGAQLLNVVVPEPSTFALAGLGSLAMMMFRRKK